MSHSNMAQKDVIGLSSEPRLPTNQTFLGLLEEGVKGIMFMPLEAFIIKGLHLSRLDLNPQTCKLSATYEMELTLTKKKTETDMSLSHIPTVSSILTRELDITPDEGFETVMKHLQEVLASWETTARAVSGDPEASAEYRLAKTAQDRLRDLEKIRKGTYILPSRVIASCDDKA